MEQLDAQGLLQPAHQRPDGGRRDVEFLGRALVAQVPAFHDYFATYQPPLLAVWGRNDPYFLPAGAHACQRDLPHAEAHLHDTGHFAVETHAVEIAATIAEFLQRRVQP